MEGLKNSLETEELLSHFVLLINIFSLSEKPTALWDLDVNSHVCFLSITFKFLACRLEEFLCPSSVGTILKLFLRLKDIIVRPGWKQWDDMWIGPWDGTDFGCSCCSIFILLGICLLAFKEQSAQLKSTIWSSLHCLVCNMIFLVHNGFYRGYISSHSEQYCLL